MAWEQIAVHDDVTLHHDIVDGLWGMYQWLDRAPKGRNETGLWFKRRDEYG